VPRRGKASHSSSGKAARKQPKRTRRKPRRASPAKVAAAPLIIEGRTIRDILRGGFTESGTAIFVTLEFAGGAAETFYCDVALLDRLIKALRQFARIARSTRAGPVA